MLRGSLCCAAVAAVAGCGGSEPDVQVVPAGAPNVQRAPIQPKVAGGAARPKPSPNRPASNDAARRGQPAPPADVPNGFVIVDEPRGFEIVGVEPELRESDQFFVEIPEAGFDSTTFAVVPPPRERPSTRTTARDGGITLPKGFVAVAEGGRSEDGLPLQIRCEKDESLMVLVPAGPFRMGSNRGPADASPEISVYVDAYYVDRHETTLGQYQKFREDVGNTGKRVRPQPKNAGAPENHPALGIPWGDAKFYAEWAGKSLPTEAQWEKAARGPESFEYPWGNGRAIWPRHRPRGEITAVMSYRADVSPLGVHDMAGNAREWSLDWYSDKAFREAGPSGATLRNWEGPRSPSSPNLRVVKGGGPNWEVWHRAGLNMRETPPDLGFRCVLNIKAPDGSDGKVQKTAGR